MSGRRRIPNQQTAPVGGSHDGLLSPPQPPPPPAPNPSDILLSTEPGEGTHTGEGPSYVPPVQPGQPRPPERHEDHRIVGEVPPTIEEVQLSPEEQVTFAQLLTCGRRSKTLHVLDHTVVVQTLCGADDLRVGLYAKPYEGTVGEQRAYQIAVAACAIRSIDGKPIVAGLFESPEDDALFDQKVKIVEKMYPAIISRIYRAALEAEQEFIELGTKLGKLNG
jgi:hypothetical protein